MDNSEMFKTEFQTALVERMPMLDDDLTKRIVMEFEKVLVKYDVQIKCTDIIVSEETIPAPVKDYLATKKIEGLSDTTIATYYKVLSMFFAAVRKQPNEITGNEIRVYLYNYQNDRGVSNRSLEAYRIVICGFFRWAQDCGYIVSNPGKTLKPIKCEKTHKCAMSREDVVKLEKACNTEREVALISFFYSTGCRIAEVAKAKKSDIDWQNRRIMLFGKGKKYRYGFLNDRAVVCLKRYFSTRNDDCDQVFVSDRKPHGALTTCGLRNVIKEIYKRAGVENISVHLTPHIIRHTTATLAIENGMPVQQVQKMLGHVSLDTTMQYVDINDNDIKSNHNKFVV